MSSALKLISTIKRPASYGECGRYSKRLLPVLDLAILNEIPTTSNNNNPVVVVTYQTAPQTPILFSAIDIQAAPQKISVAGTEACGLPDSYTDKFREVVISCFSYQGQVIPILNFSLLFSGQFNELLTIGPPSKQSVQLGIA